jgi:uncharacterized protein DUF4062
LTANVPAVFVSSTFYDLVQVREDLRQFISSLGYRPLLSELPSFPVDPTQSTIDNCRRIVEQEADMLVLVIGGRYGKPVPKDLKSVTNLEYLTARAKGIPIFAFVDTRVLALLDHWRDNPDANFSATVDTPKLFEFIEKVRAEDSVWMDEFDKAGDIQEVLRIRWAYLMKRGLGLIHAMRSEKAALDALRGLRGQALQIAVEKPSAWEYKFFGHALLDAVAEHAELRQEYQLGIVHPPREDAGQTFDEVLHWVRARMVEAEAITGNTDVLINKVLVEAFGPPGKPGSVGQIAFAARQLGRSYESALRWALRLNSAYVGDEDWEPPIRALGAFLSDAIHQVETFGQRVLSEIRRGEELSVTATIQKPYVINIVLQVKIPDEVYDRFKVEMKTLLRKYGLDDSGFD